jgi:diphthamide biosynthesis protein 2
MSKQQHSSSSSGSAVPLQRPTAPRLLFDDGSRVILQEQQEQQTLDIVDSDAAKSTQRNSRYAQARGSLPLVEYYEIERIVKEIQKLSSKKTSTSWRNRIALQFPDELLVDAPDVCWELEQALIIALEDDNNTSINHADNDNDEPPLVFCLGDTTYQSCCPDLVAAAHLQADCLVHYGHACLSNHNNTAAAASASSTTTIPVIYSFGRAELPVEHVAQQVLAEIQNNITASQEVSSVQDHRILLLSEVRFVYAMEQLQQRLMSAGNVQVAIGRILENRVSLSKPSYNQNDSPPPQTSSATASCGSPSCCQAAINDDNEQGVCKSKEEDANAVPSSASKTTATQEDLLLTCKEHGFIVGGLQLPRELSTWTSPFTLLFVGSDDSRQYLNIVLRFLSSTNSEDSNAERLPSPTHYWTWNPTANRLSTQLSPRFKRQLNRRFYLVQKARLAKVFGLLVANLSDVYMQSVVHSLRSLIEEHSQNQSNKACYTFVVGKINPAKISNFAEIDCFVMVACPEHSLLLLAGDDEREYPVPIITPLELTMALGLVEWGSVAYSLDSHDYLLRQQQQQDNNVNKGDGAAVTSDDEDNDSDAPYFNPVTGRYEASVKHHHNNHDDDADLNLAALPGQGTLSKYTSAAADFLKKREYQGLQVNAGETKVEAAKMGQQGIASNYGER